MSGQGALGKARDLLAPVYGWFNEGFETADLKEAKALLDEFASADWPARAGVAGGPCNVAYLTSSPPSTAELSVRAPCIGCFLFVKAHSRVSERAPSTSKRP